MRRIPRWSALFILLFVSLAGCSGNARPRKPIVRQMRPNSVTSMVSDKSQGVRTDHIILALKKDILIGEYYDFMDSLVTYYDSITTYPLSEYIIVHANKWLIDTLARSDYYYNTLKDSLVMDNRYWIAIKKESRLNIPDSVEAAGIQQMLDQVLIDINIPEFMLRLYVGDSMIRKIPVRVGQNRSRYLELAGREVDMRTHHGAGKIVRVNRDPLFLNPVDGERFYLTRRDDNIVTQMPRIPWIETEINGIRYGQMLHPTTNPKTLGKAYSNGCIGMSEMDAWYVYLYSPLGTKVQIRYDLEIPSEKGDSIIHLKDIYGLKKAS